MPPQSVFAEQGRNHLNGPTLEAIEKLELKYKEEQNTIHTLWGVCQTPIRWWLLTWHIVYHSIALYTLINLTQIKLWTWLFAIFTSVIAIFGSTSGPHRLWGHKSYKATKPLRTLIGFCYMLTGQYSPFSWARDHRIHHKFTDTSRDPYTVKRGYFFAHIGWLLIRRHPEYLRAMTKVDFSDLLQDSVLMFFHRNYLWTLISIWGLFGVGFPMYFWGESLFWSFCAGVVRTVAAGHIVATTNSYCHYGGSKPYDKNSTAGNSTIAAVFLLGEGYHNFHHAFPWDYRGSEHFNVTRSILDSFGLIGWAYDFKTASADLIRRVTIKNGDGTHPIYKRCGNEQEDPLLGYDPFTY